MPRFAGMLATLALASMALASPAHAADESLDLTVEQSLTYHGKRSVLETPYFLRGAKHPKVVKTLGTMKTDKRTRSIGRAAEHACSIAFQSAIIQLQERAVQLGGNAVVDIVSLVGGQEVEVPGGFRCRVGKIVVNVVLTGQAVQLAD